MPRIRFRPHVVGLLLGGGAFLVGGAVALVAVSGFGRHAPPAQQQASVIDMKTNPIGPGAQMTNGLPSEIGVLPFTALLPESDDGSTEIQTSWIRVDVEPALAVQLASGVLIMERLAEVIDFPTDTYYLQLAEEVPGASIDQINGASALVIQSTADLGNPSSVDIILRGVHVSIIGAVGQDASELVALASAIPATGAGTPTELRSS